ncbi:hypothetical protein SUGI_0901420 [Cryptomeria japonica]|uniref:DNA replication ATP-dependent helicase/nuclease JHS1 n=1 Tax=Cryptomeria japonica TaxID=3369 RepID=UPI002414C6C2|nr:DNA replication ATP-dependent helicase/nuclease JHS1 [Cryptomeria japonica]GLJ43384.1 hypothetical protein SUGI_0901420 [Cryptomeria japonica]
MAPKRQSKDSKKHKDPGPSRRGAAASKKPNQNTNSQPAKFGIQHFWGRLTQNGSQNTDSQTTEQSSRISEIAIPDKPSEAPYDQVPDEPKLTEEVPCDQLLKDPQRTPVLDKYSVDANNGRSCETEIIDEQECTPEAHIRVGFGSRLGTVSGSGSAEQRKCVKRSPALTQDDGVDDVKYKKTPVMVRLESITKRRCTRNPIQLNAHQLNCTPIRACMEKKDMSTILNDASKLNCTPVSEDKSSSSLAGKVQQWLSSPGVRAFETSKLLSKECSSDLSNKNKENILTHINVDLQASQTPIKKNKYKQKVARHNRKALIELIDEVENVLSDSSLVTKDENIAEKQPMEEGASGSSTVIGVSGFSREEINLDFGCQNISVEPSISSTFIEKPFSTSENGVSFLEEHDSSIFQNSLVNSSVSQERFDAMDQDICLLKPSSNTNGVHQNMHFLVLEVADMESNANESVTRSSVKVLRLLNEQSGLERILHLCDEWSYSVIRPGDTVNVIGEFDSQGKCVIDHENNILIVHPDLLISGSRVGTSFSCPRRAVLDERIKSFDLSAAALMGTMLHQIFQVGLVHETPSKKLLEQQARTILQTYIDSIYATGGNEVEIYTKLIGAIPTILNWIDTFKCKSISTMPTIDFGRKGGEKQLSVSEVVDIEEMVWSPKYGLKGMIDASLRVKFDSHGSLPEQVIMPLEFKTGRGTTGQAAMEHRAQVILYTLLMSDRYMQDIGSGLLYYLHTNQTQGVAVQHADLIGLMMRRNDHASNLLAASSTQLLPPMLKSYSMCQGCRHLDACTVYHKVQEGGTVESSGLGDMFDSHVRHLSNADCDFLRHWNQLIDLEAQDSQVACSEIWRKPSSQREEEGGCLSSMVLDSSSNRIGETHGKSGQYIYCFCRKDSYVCKKTYSVMQKNDDAMPCARPASFLERAFKCADHVILSTESGHVAVASGFIIEITHSSITISLSHQLRLAGYREDELSKLLWRIDKDEAASSYAIMRFNLLQLFVKSNCDDHRRKLIVDLQPPRFDSGTILSQDPAVLYARSAKDLNGDQCRAIHKMLSAKDYALILGMPGTGKTSTMVHAVKALLARGSSILLTSYTNSAVDNLLLKLKDQGIEFLRLGRNTAIHKDIHEYTISGMGINSVKELEARINQACVVGVTCLGIGHPLLAKKRFDVCIVDEAGQITLPVCLGPIMYARTFVLVGDHYQLPPLVRSAEARENGMGISLFRRLSEAHPQAVSALQCQYRMCAGVMKLSNVLIYGNRLRCGSSAVADARLEIKGVSKQSLWLREVLDPNRSVFFLNTDLLSAPETKVHNAINNPTEASFLLKIVEALVNGGVCVNDVGVISPYNSQVNLIRRFAVEAQLPSLEVHTIDKYQGRDKDCILVSFVRSNNHTKSSGLSLLADWHRINVAITRAKKKLIMIGSQKTLSGTPLLRLLIEQVEQDNGLLHLPQETLLSPWLKRCGTKS